MPPSEAEEQSGSSQAGSDEDPWEVIRENPGEDNWWEVKAEWEESVREANRRVDMKRSGHDTIHFIMRASDPENKIGIRTRLVDFLL